VTVERVEFHVEEPSMEAFLRGLLPRILTDVDFDVFVYQGQVGSPEISARSVASAGQLGPQDVAYGGPGRPRH